MSNTDPIEQILISSTLGPDTLRSVRRLIEALARALTDCSFDELLQTLGTENCPIQGIAGHADITVIPARGAGACTPIVLAIARGRGGQSPRSLPAVMREVRAHAISCLEITEVVLLLTDRWDPDLLAESEPDFRAHAKRPVSNKVLIPLVAWKQQLTAYP